MRGSDKGQPKPSLEPPSKKQVEVVYVRMSPDLLVRMDERIHEEVEKGAMGRITRSDFVRYCVERVLKEGKKAPGNGG